MYYLHKISIFFILFFSLPNRAFVDWIIPLTRLAAERFAELVKVTRAANNAEFARWMLVIHDP